MLQEGAALREKCMAERKEAKQGQYLSTTAAHREAGHMRKAIADRNKRVRDAVKEANARQKAQDRARRAQEQAEARQREEEERERLREAQNANRSRASLPRQASSDARRNARAESPPGRGERLPYAGGARLNVASEEDLQPTADQGEGNADRRDIVREIIDLGREGVRPVPRRGTGPTAAFQELIDAMTFPGAQAEPGEILAAIINNQYQLAQQNATILKAVQNKNEVRIYIIVSRMLFIENVIFNSGNQAGTQKDRIETSWNRNRSGATAITVPSTRGTAPGRRHVCHQQDHAISPAGGNYCARRHDLRNP